jgi:type I site-specific restriction-modification system R (restriction) subunit
VETVRALAHRKIAVVHSPSLLEGNREVHGMLVDGVPVEHQRPDGSIAGAQARVLDFDDVDANDWVAVNQFTVVEGKIEKVKRILRKYGYPPDKQEKATETVLEQAAVLSEEWAVA